jgi:dephospho-CoA kinase
MLIVGLTGGIGAGKSTVARLLAERGAHVIDVDGLGRRVLAPGGRAEAAVREAFGPQVLAPDGSIDRSAIAKAVFSNQDALARLTNISHPAMNEEIVEELQTLPGSTIAVLDMAILVESNLGQVGDPYQYRFVVTVEADPSEREERAVARGSARDDVRRRMANQADDAMRRDVADVVIVNDGSLADLVNQVDHLWERLTAMNRAEPSATSGTAS